MKQWFQQLFTPAERTEKRSGRGKMDTAERLPVDSLLIGKVRELGLAIPGETFQSRLLDLTEFLNAQLAHLEALTWCVDDSGRHLHPVAGNTFESLLSQQPAVDMENGAYSAGRAAASKGAIITIELVSQTPEDWVESHILPMKLCACWSMPILTCENQVAGVVELYARDKRGPSAPERLILEFIADRAGIIYDRVQQRQMLPRGALQAKGPTIDPDYELDELPTKIRHPRPQSARHALRESERRFRTIFENSGLGIVLIRPDGHLIESNAAFRDLVEVEDNSLHDLFLDDVLDKTVPNDALVKFKETMKRKDGYYQTEARFMTRSGRSILTKLTISFIRNSVGKNQFAIAMIEDVTHQTEVLNALRESKENYRTLFDGIPVGLYRTKPDGTILDANPTTVSMLGYKSKDELLGSTTHVHFVRPDDRKRWLSILEQVGLVRSFETKLRRKDGKEIWVRENSNAVCDESGKILFLEGSLEDVTIQKRMEQRLVASEERYRDLVENSEDLIFAHDLDGTVISANQACLRQLGFSHNSELVGKNLREILPQNMNQQFPEYIKRIRKTGQAADYVQIVTRNGSVRVFEFRNSLRRNFRGKALVRGIARDVTQKIVTQRALAAQKERLSVTLKSIGDGVITTDPQGRIVLVNKVAEQLLGWENSSALAKPVTKIFKVYNEKTGEPIEDAVEQVLTNRSVYELDHAVVLKTQHDVDRLVTIYAAPLQNKSNKLVGALLVFRDVSKLLTLEEEVYKSHKLESLGVLAGGIAHDFNNILTAILGNISLAKLTTEANDPVYRRMNEAERAAERARGLTQQLLTFAKGGAPIKKAASVIDVVRETCDFTMHGRNCTCEYTIGDDIWPAEIDKDQISQVINNLAVNGMQAMKLKGTLHVGCKNISVNPDNQFWDTKVKEGDYVLITVRDEGKGIPAKFLPYIFDPYFTTKNQGSGLGLATSYSIVKRHGGYTFVESVEGTGTLFTLLLPAKPQATIEEEDRSDSVEHGSGRLLIMDDDHDIREVLGEMLVDLGYEVTAVNDGDAAVESYRQSLTEGKSFDAVIVDLTIPGGMGGKETVKALHELHAEARVIVSSGYSNDPVLAHFESFGFLDRISKPFNVAIVSKTVKRVLSKQLSIEGEVQDAR